MLVELEILNYILAKKDFSFIINNNLDYTYFINLRNEFNFIQNHYKKYNQVPDLTTFLSTFSSFEVIDVTESLEYLLSELNRCKNENYLVGEFNKIKDLLMAGKTDEAMDLASQISTRANTSKQMEAVDILSDTSRYDAYIDKCNDFNRYYITTGFKELDDSLGGGIDRLNSYFVISARPGIGKTLIMIKFAAAAASKGLRVGFYEGEMTPEKIAGRYDTLTSHISNSAITHGNISISTQYKKYLDSLSKNVKGNLFVLTRDMVNTERMTVNVLSNFVEKYNLDILFIDQLSLLDSTSRSTKSFEQAAEISKAIKNLQVRKHIPIVVASQQNRDAVEEGKFAGTENLSLSDRIGQDASEVVNLSKKDNIMTINIAKARDGCKKYVLKYLVDFDKGTFEYMPDEDDNEQTTSTIDDLEYDDGENVF